MYDDVKDIEDDGRSKFVVAGSNPVLPTINQTFNRLDKLIELFENEKAELRAEIEKLRKAKGKK